MSSLQNGFFGWKEYISVKSLDSKHKDEFSLGDISILNEEMTVLNKKWEDVENIEYEKLCRYQEKNKKLQIINKQID